MALALTLQLALALQPAPSLSSALAQLVEAQGVAPCERSADGRLAPSHRGPQNPASVLHHEGIAGRRMAWSRRGAHHPCCDGALHENHGNPGHSVVLNVHWRLVLEHTQNMTASIVNAVAIASSAAAGRVAVGAFVVSFVLTEDPDAAAIAAVAALAATFCVGRAVHSPRGARASDEPVSAGR